MHYGNDKAQHLLNLFYRQFHFVVLQDHFLVHLPHKLAEWADQRLRNEHIGEVLTLTEQFKFESGTEAGVNWHTGVRTRIPNHPAVSVAIGLPICSLVLLFSMSGKPITNRQSPFTNHQPPITNHQSPITHHPARVRIMCIVLEPTTQQPTWKSGQLVPHGMTSEEEHQDRGPEP